ncbi:MAG: thymidine kinase [Verrucomicrobiota bacterium]
MAQVYFYYSAMNAGKSTSLLQSSHNYRERGMNTLLLTPKIDERDGLDNIASRIGLQSDAHGFSPEEDLHKLTKARHAATRIACVLIDEAQFLTTEQVEQICGIADDLEIPVLCYGLRTDFQGKLFDGSAALLAWADNLVELKTICHCGKKATMNLRMDSSGQAVREGEQIEIGGNEKYIAMCRKHFHEALGPI